jgi:hypothetical protein
VPRSWRRVRFHGTRRRDKATAELRCREALGGQCPQVDDGLANDAHGFNRPGFVYVTQLSTDGFPGYPEAVDLAFGPYAKFGTLIKEYKNANMPYTPSEMVGSQRRPVFGMLPHEARSICTSHVERHNLTIRTLMKRFTRLSLGFSKKLANLQAAVSAFISYYNFCWRTRDAVNGRTRPPAAMMAGVTDRLWSFVDLFDTVNQN